MDIAIVVFGPSSSASYPVNMVKDAESAGIVVKVNDSTYALDTRSVIAHIAIDTGVAARVVFAMAMSTLFPEASIMDAVDSEAMEWFEEQPNLSETLPDHINQLLTRLFE